MEKGTSRMNVETVPVYMPLRAGRGGAGRGGGRSDV